MINALSMIKKAPGAARTIMRIPVPGLERRRCRYIDNITSPNWSATMEK